MSDEDKSKQPGDSGSVVADSSGGGGEHQVARDDRAGGNAAGVTLPLFSGQADAGEKPATGKPVTAPAKTSLASRVRSGVKKLLGGDSLPACSCTKKPGVQGRHQKTCARFGGDGGTAARPVRRLFVAPDLSRVVEPVEIREAVAPVDRGEQVAAPKNHSFYRRLATRFYNTRSKFKVLTKEQRLEPIVGEREAEKMAAEYGLSREEIEALGEELERCAREESWPEVSPVMSCAVMFLEIELRWKITDWVQERRIKKIAALKKLQQAATPPPAPSGASAAAAATVPAPVTALGGAVRSAEGMD